MGITILTPAQIAGLIVPDQIPEWPDWLRYENGRHVHDMTWLRHGIYAVRQRGREISMTRHLPYEIPVRLHEEGAFEIETLVLQTLSSSEDCVDAAAELRETLIKDVVMRLL